MKKIIKILICLILICIFLNITLSRYVEERTDISRKIGQIWTGGEISTRNYAVISNAFNSYLQCLKDGNYETAYKMFTYEYSLYKEYEEFVEEIREINFNETQIQDIIRRTEYVYSIIFNIEDEQKENLLIFNSENTAYSIIPETFLEHKILGEKQKKRKVEYEVIDTVNYVDKFIANINITNLNKKDIIQISDIKLINGAKKISGNIQDLKLNPSESKLITVEFETYIDFPNQIEISRYIEKKNTIETYVFNLD